jgi:arginine exporter protein ArgO
MIKQVLKMISAPFALGAAHFLFSDSITRDFYLFFMGMIGVGALLVWALTLIEKTYYIGFSYLGFLGLKLIVFMILFGETLETLTALEPTSRAAYLIPFFVSLLVEIGALYKVLNHTSK